MVKCLGNDTQPPVHSSYDDVQYIDLVFSMSVCPFEYLVIAHYRKVRCLRA